MGFLGRVFRRVTSFVGRAASFVQKGLDFIQKPLSSLISKPLSSLMGKVLDKLPFGIGKFIKPFAEKFLNNALSFLAPGGIGILGALTKAIPSLSKLTDVVKGISDVVGGINKLNLPQAQSNITELVAFRQSQLI